MSCLYQISGLLITALCHVIVIYYLSEHKYPKKRFTLYGCMYAAGFVGIGGYGYAVGGSGFIFYIHRDCGMHVSFFMYCFTELLC